MFIGAGVIILAATFLVFSALKSSHAYFYLTVSELLPKYEEMKAHNLRVTGLLVKNSLTKGANPLEYSFTMQDRVSKELLTVAYKGILPDSFQHGEEVVAVGKLSDKTTFTATSLITKCPSKYESK
jgi:cytochrome c-type biogenesis protein CcmE